MSAALFLLPCVFTETHTHTEKERHFRNEVNNKKNVTQIMSLKQFHFFFFFLEELQMQFNNAIIQYINTEWRNVMEGAAIQ